MAKKTTLKDQVYENIFTDIMNGLYTPDMVLSEKFLMEKYQFSRAPIREALLQLTSKKFLESIPRQGYRITQPNKAYMTELGHFRSILESAFLQANITRIDAACLQELHQICKHYAECPEPDFMARWKYNCEFHLKLFSTYQNEYAYDTLENALYLQTIYFVQTKHQASMDLHLAVLDYIEKGDAVTAAKILQADIEALVAAGKI